MTTLHTDSYIRADFINESVFSLKKLPLTGAMGLSEAAF